MSDRTPTSLPPRVEVQTESETGRGWVYTVVVHHEGAVTEHAVSLAWCDHDYWSGGRMAPSRVVQVVVECALRAAARDLPARFDASTVRRWSRAMDTEIRGRL
ncbi:MAG: hypothetical protein JNK25_10095 [Phycisphaerae bacterium]|nr:hypothetical protein [Phycisphaerae bacterium]